MPIDEIWRRIEEMFDVAALDRMVRPKFFDTSLACPYHQASPDSLPDSPRSLSPLPKSSRHAHANSLSPLSNASRSPSPSSAKPSKSAQLINSSYFGTPFTLPYFRQNQNEWKSTLTSNDSGKRRRSRSVASTSTHTDTEKGFFLNEDEVEINGPDLKTWHDTIYEGRPTEGVDQDAEEKEWILAQQQIDDRDKEAEAEAEAKLEKPKPKKKPGRPSKARKEKEDSSELSDAAGDAQEEEDEEEAPKTGRARRATAGKRKRDSTAKEESEDEKEVKETVSRPLLTCAHG